jgi:hypothetical protein
MKKVICSVFDVKALVYSDPFFSTNIMTATRDFSYAANDATTSIGRNPEDFSLYCLGDFDDSTAIVTLLPNAELVASASSLITF